MLEIVMYHYVRNLKRSRFPNIKGLDFNNFITQIEHFRKSKNFIHVQDIINFYEHREPLPPNAMLLTFDDAYLDHYRYVLPVLDKYKIQGVFFAPAKCILEKKVLDVNKIHFILASGKPTELIIYEIENIYNNINLGSQYKDFSYYKALPIPPSRWDTKEVMFIKMLLQQALPLEIREKVVNQLFSAIVSNDEHAFAEELYMNEWQLQTMITNGMIIGGHSYDHYWLEKLSKEEQYIQVEKSTQFLKDLGVKNEDLHFGYPYGSFNDSLLSIMKCFNYKLGFTTKATKSNLLTDDPLLLPRLDTNDFYPLKN